MVHAHNPTTLKLYDKMGLNPFNKNELTESKYVLGNVCVAEGEAGTEELARNIASASNECSAVIIPKHGAFAFASTPLNATEKLFALEYTAKYYYQGA